MAKSEDTEQQWRDKLTPDQFRVCREGGTEPAFTGKYWNTKDAGLYHCAACGEPLFTSATKYDSGSGWPSFYSPYSADSVAEHDDNSLGMRRVEVVCKGCESHLGHVFPDGPPETGLRYCINSAALDFQADSDGSDD